MTASAPGEPKSLATRKADAAKSGARAAGYCALVHPDGGASCTRRPHDDRRHMDYYNGRKKLGDAYGIEWVE